MVEVVGLVALGLLRWLADGNHGMPAHTTQVIFELGPEDMGGQGLGGGNGGKKTKKPKPSW